ncbi:MAG: hypothetical protein ACR2P0_04020 [Acidimicrobiales bacterium]
MLARRSALLTALAILAGACGSGADDGPATTTSTSGLDFPNVIEAVAVQAEDGSWRFDVTISSRYDTPEQYADAWRVVGPDGTELGIRVLTHDHASEQPFTRSQSGIEIPDVVDRVTIEGRDLVNGWGGATLEIDLERS